MNQLSDYMLNASFMLSMKDSARLRHHGREGHVLHLRPSKKTKKSAAHFSSFFTSQSKQQQQPQAPLVNNRAILLARIPTIPYHIDHATDSYCMLRHRLAVHVLFLDCQRPRLEIFSLHVSQTAWLFPEMPLFLRCACMEAWQANSSASTAFPSSVAAHSSSSRRSDSKRCRKSRCQSPVRSLGNVSEGP